MVGLMVQGGQHAPVPTPVPAPAPLPVAAAPPAKPDMIPLPLPNLVIPVPLPPPPLLLNQPRNTLPDFMKCNRYFDGATGYPNEVEDWLA